MRSRSNLREAAAALDPLPSVRTGIFLAPLD
jgi:hypothetical protein